MRYSNQIEVEAAGSSGEESLRIGMDRVGIEYTKGVAEGLQVWYCDTK